VRAFIGSFIVMFVGAFSIVGGLRNHPPALDSIVGGVTMILGAFAYRSAKRRRLGLKAGSGLRRGFEVGVLILVVLPIVPLGLKGVDFIANNPISGILVPVLSVVAYVWMCKRKITVAESDVPSIR
jgi:drug/metabolite transporter (DMT)-like permease